PTTPCNPRLHGGRPGGKDRPHRDKLHGAKDQGATPRPASPRSDGTHDRREGGTLVASPCLAPLGAAAGTGPLRWGSLVGGPLSSARGAECRLRSAPVGRVGRLWSDLCVCDGAAVFSDI